MKKYLSLLFFVFLVVNPSVIYALDWFGVYGTQSLVALSDVSLYLPSPNIFSSSYSDRVTSEYSSGSLSYAISGSSAKVYTHGNNNPSVIVFVDNAISSGVATQAQGLVQTGWGVVLNDPLVSLVPGDITQFKIPVNIDYNIFVDGSSYATDSGGYASFWFYDTIFTPPSAMTWNVNLQELSSGEYRKYYKVAREVTVTCREIGDDYSCASAPFTDKIYAHATVAKGSIAAIFDPIFEIDPTAEFLPGLKSADYFGIIYDSVESVPINSVPIPSTLFLLIIVLTGLVGLHRMKNASLERQ